MKMIRALRDRRVIRALMAVAILPWLLPSSSAYAFQARINRPQIQEVRAPGEAASGTIELENISETPVVIEVYLQDWEYEEGGNGDKLFTTPGTSSHSASSWISFFPQRLELPARGRGVVEYTIRVPEGAAGGHYAVLFFESMLGSAPGDDAGVTVKYTGRMGSLIEVEVAGTQQRTGEISQLQLSPFDEERPLTLSYAFQNTGNVVIRPKAFFNIVDAAGRYFGRGEFPQIYTHPGRGGTAATEWTGNLPPGEYTVLLTVDLGEQQVAVAEQALHVPGTTAQAR